MATTGIRIEGLAELRQALKRMDTALPKGITVALADSARFVANRARREAPVRSGRLQGSVRPFAGALSAGVRVSATRSSRRYPAYPYPRRLEYEPPPRGRPFLRRAVEESLPRVMERISFVMSDIEEIWSSR